MNHTFNKTYDAILPAGSYFVGDVCYFLHDSLMKDVWSSKFNYSSGCFTRADGAGFAITKPHAGNGFYAGSNRFIYDVEEDNLGVVPVSMGDKSKFTGCGTFHDFKDPVSVSVDDDGMVTIKSGDWVLEIDTSESGSIHSEDEGYDSWG